MFSLIITIVSVALVAALAVATIYYGSDAAEKGRISARAGAIVSAGEQVAAGLSVYRLNTGRWPDTLETMVTEKYLNGLPEIAAADSLSFIASAHAAPAVEGDWLYDPVMPHLAYVRPISLEVCAEVNRRINGRRMVLNVLDPGIKVQCAAAGGDPVVVFRNSEVPLTTPPAIPGAPEVGSPGVFEDVSDIIDSEGEDTTGHCTYACEPNGEGGGGTAGEGGGGVTPPDAESPPSTTTVEPAPVGGDWVPEGAGYCSPPDLPDLSESTLEYAESVMSRRSNVTISGEWYISAESDEVVGLGAIVDGEVQIFDAYSGDSDGWAPFSFELTASIDSRVGFVAQYLKGESGAEDEDRACVRGITMKIEELESPDISSADAACSQNAQYAKFSEMTPEIGGSEEEYYEVFYKNCSPLIFPSDWDVSSFDRAELTGVGFEPIVARTLQRNDVDYGVLPSGEALSQQEYDDANEYAYVVPDQVATLTAYDTEGGVIGQMPVPIAKMPEIRLTRVGQPYSWVPFGVTAEYSVSFSSTAHAPFVAGLPDAMTLLDADSILWDTSKSGGLYVDRAAEIKYEDTRGFASQADFSELIYEDVIGKRSTVSSIVCTSPGQDWFNTRITVSMYPDNPDGANLVNPAKNRTGRYVTVSLIDLPESAPHKFVPVGPYTVNVLGQDVSTPVAGVDYSASYGDEYSVMKKYTYTLSLAATALSSTGTVRVLNRFDLPTYHSVDLRSTDEPASAQLKGSPACSTGGGGDIGLDKDGY